VTVNSILRPRFSAFLNSGCRFLPCSVESGHVGSDSDVDVTNGLKVVQSVV